jgi:hypothetical protein
MVFGVVAAVEDRSADLPGAGRVAHGIARANRRGRAWR